MSRLGEALRPLRSGKVAFLAAALAAIALVVPTTAQAHHPTPPHAVPAPPANPTRADQIQNVDQVKTAIKAYYGDTVSTTQTNPDGTPMHLASPTSAYAKEMHGIEAQAATYLFSKHGKGWSKYIHHAKGKKAIVLDVDDTTLNTYNYEIFSSFVYNPTTNAEFVNGGLFPAVFGMPTLVNAAKAHGYTIFFLTGRPITQTAGTVANLASAGYPSVPSSQLFLKDLTAPWLASCATTTPSCTTDQYKALTRKHIASLGYDIVANFGDQFSDLSSGGLNSTFEDRAFKIPNPMYFLP